MQAFPQQDHQAHIKAHLAIMATPPVQANVAIAAAIQGHIQEHIGLLAEQKAQEQVMSQIPPEQQQMLQQDPNMQQQMQMQIQTIASQLIAEMIEQYAQTVAPQNQNDPLVEFLTTKIKFVRILIIFDFFCPPVRPSEAKGRLAQGVDIRGFDSWAFTENLRVHLSV